MIEFMVIAAPRSATTWAANWLTTDTTLCLHDPLYQWYYQDLDHIQTEKVLGVSCTGLYHFPAWLNQHPARKVILHRPYAEIVDSMLAIGLPPPSPADIARLHKIDGLHCQYTDVFENPEEIYRHLLGKPLDIERHAQLVNIEMQPLFSGITVNKEVTRQLIAELLS